MRQELWKRAVGILTACLMIFTAVPVTALADGEAAGALENIAANCEITVPSEQNGDLLALQAKKNQGFYQFRPGPAGFCPHRDAAGCGV